MADKVNTAVFGKDLRVEMKNYPISANGNKINIVSAGDGYFMPEIGPTNFLDFPSWKRYYLFGPRTYKRVFFARKKASKCVDFGTDEGIVYGPDSEQLKKANMALLATKIGQDANKETPWYIWFILLVLIGITLKVFGVIV